ncbi:hypothetical protein HRbin27_01097 [bacterium HR27]|nr:hypothetical protein HRbin27_01097 [bacterium HR27]
MRPGVPEEGRHPVTLADAELLERVCQAQRLLGELRVPEAADLSFVDPLDDLRSREVALCPEKYVPNGQCIEVHTARPSRLVRRCFVHRSIVACTRTSRLRTGNDREWSDRA